MLDKYKGIDGDKTYFHTCPDGSKHNYDTLSVKGIKLEGSYMPTATSEKDAWRMYYESLDSYLYTRKGTIVWRQKPVLEKHDSGYAIYSRLTVVPQAVSQTVV